MNNDILISVVIPCLNEEKTIGLCLEKAIQALNSNNIEGEIIVSDNGSTDNSVEIAKKYGVKVVYCNKKGYGNTLIQGINNAIGKYILIGDADNTYDFSILKDFYEQAISNKDIKLVMGSRFKGIIEKGAMPFLHRYLGNPLLTYIINILFKGNISDSQCGLRLFEKESFDRINFSSTGMEFATEIIIEFLLHNYKIVEIPVNLYKNPPGRKPHIRTWKDGFRILNFILKKRFVKKKSNI